jgi:SAM-dependent methyltransferase
MAQDSSIADFWETRYRSLATPWDAGQVPAMLAEFLRGQAPVGPVLIPGCGSGYEVKAFCEAGWDVTAIDFSLTAVERAKDNCGPWTDRIQLVDFFNYAPQQTDFALIYERTFLCALPRHRWTGYVWRMTELLRPGGRLVGFFFFDDNAKGPPFGLLPGQQAELFGPAFTLLEERPVPADQSVAVLAGRERWQIWGRL